MQAMKINIKIRLIINLTINFTTKKKNSSP